MICIYIYIFVDLSLKPCLAVNPLGFCCPLPPLGAGLRCITWKQVRSMVSWRHRRCVCVCVLVIRACVIFSRAHVEENAIKTCNKKDQVTMDRFFCWWLRLNGCGWFCTWTWPMFEEFVKALPLLFLNWLAVATTIKCNLEATKWDRWGHQKFYETQGWCVPKSDPQGLKIMLWVRSDCEGRTTNPGPISESIWCCFLLRESDLLNC